MSLLVLRLSIRVLAGHCCGCTQHSLCAAAGDSTDRWADVCTINALEEACSQRGNNVNVHDRSMCRHTAAHQQHTKRCVLGLARYDTYALAFLKTLLGIDDS